MLKWTSAKVKIVDLKEYEANPRRISKRDMGKLISSIKQDGYHQRIIVDQDYTIVGGHQRKQALLKAGFNLDDTIEVLIPNRKLTAEELDRINIRDNLPFGEFDFDMLANRFDIDTLMNWGMKESILTGSNEEIFNKKKNKDNLKSCKCNCCKH